MPNKLQRAFQEVSSLSFTKEYASVRKFIHLHSHQHKTRDSTSQSQTRRGTKNLQHRGRASVKGTVLWHSLQGRVVACTCHTRREIGHFCKRKKEGRRTKQNNNNSDYKHIGNNWRERNHRGNKTTPNTLSNTITVRNK